MAKDNIHIDQLITRYLTGEATREEMARLEKWMDESDANKKYFGDIRFVHDNAVASHKIVEFDVDKGWELFKQNRAQGKQVTIEKKSLGLPINNWLRVAAAIFVLIGVAYIIKSLVDPGTERFEIAVVAEKTTKATKLSDSTEVFLNKNSKIEYSAGYGKKQRMIKLTGEAYFDVKHDNEKPFIVSVDEVFVKDIGTAFNVKAYENDNKIEVYVKTGSVVFYAENQTGDTLRAGEISYYDKASKLFSKQKSTDEEVLNYKNRVLVFKDARLSEVIKSINAVYNVNISLANGAIGNCRINVSFDNDDISSIITVISETFNLKVSQMNDTYILDGNGCAE